VFFVDQDKEALRFRDGRRVCVSVVGRMGDFHTRVEE
jgi:hypothetical protein